MIKEIILAVTLISTLAGVAAQPPQEAPQEISQQQTTTSAPAVVVTEPQSKANNNKLAPISKPASYPNSYPGHSKMLCELATEMPEESNRDPAVYCN